MESHDEFKSEGKCCGDESPSTSSEDTVNEERLAGWSRTQIDTNKFVEQQKLALAAIADKNYKAAADYLTVMINMNPSMSPLYVKRANCFLNLNIPHACFIDCNCALRLNPDSGLAYKYRGWAQRVSGHLEQAVQDLRLAFQLHYDTQADEWLREATNILELNGERERRKNSKDRP